MKSVLKKLRTRKRTGKDTVDSHWLTVQASEVGMHPRDLSMQLMQAEAIAPVAGKFLLYRITL